MPPLVTLSPALHAWNRDLSFASADPLPQVTNPVWRVVTTEGRRFVLKELPEYPPGVRPVDEYRVLCHLASVGVPVALPVLTDDARLMSTVDGREYVLLPMIEHDTDNHELRADAAATARSVGAAIGRLDAALAASPWQPSSFVDDPARQILDETLPQLPDLASLVAPIQDGLRAAVLDLPAQLNHGDCNTGNVLVRGTEVVGFLDLDHLPQSPRARDLSHYLASRLRRHLAQDDRSAQRDAHAWTAALTHYLTGYHSALPLSDRELAAVVPLIIVTEIGSTAWCVNGWVPDPTGYDHGVAVLTWLLAHVEELTAAAMIG